MVSRTGGRSGLAAPGAFRVALGAVLAAAFASLGCASGAGGSELPGLPEGASLACGEQRSPALCRSVAELRAVNLGNALEAPREGEWGVTLNRFDFKLIADAGFNSIRVPIRWNAHALDAAPYTIDESFFERVDWVLEQASANGLHVLINMHHYEDLFARPGDHDERFLALWDQIARRYAGRSDETLWFEPLNEPHAALQGVTWQRLMQRAIEVIRRSNPTRPVMVGGDGWNAYDRLGGLDLPDDDRLILTFHYYLPFNFTHQGAQWVDNMDRHLGTTWDGSAAERRAVVLHFETVAAAARAHRLPVVLGEFGAYGAAPLDSRARWTAHVARTAEAYGYGWMYWEFRSGFGVFGGSGAGWNEPLLTALLPE